MQDIFRLIETWDVLKRHLRKKESRTFRRLIETWDVLKHTFCRLSDSRWHWLIETWDVLKLICGLYIAIYLTINRNMRCIETAMNPFTFFAKIRLIETWDVLKPVKGFSPTMIGFRLIETWDVLKLSPAESRRRVMWLIETWDVLKLV